MPFRLCWEPHGVVKTLWGFVSGDELVESAARIAASPMFDDLRYIIVDCLQVAGFSIEPDHMDHLAIIRMGSYYTNPNIRIVLLSRDPLALAFVREPDFRAHVLTYETRVFDAMADGRAWLDAQPPLNKVRHQHPKAM